MKITSPIINSNSLAPFQKTKLSFGHLCEFDDKPQEVKEKVKALNTLIRTGTGISAIKAHVTLKSLPPLVAYQLGLEHGAKEYRNGDVGSYYHGQHPYVRVGINQILTGQENKALLFIKDLEPKL